VSHRSDSNLGFLAKKVVGGKGEATLPGKGASLFAQAIPYASRGPAVSDLAPTGIQPILVQVVLGAMFWFLAVEWLYFAWGRHVDFDLAIASGLFVMLLTLLLLVAPVAVSDPPASDAGTEDERRYLELDGRS
jgi:hypothetical protein